MNSLLTSITKEVSTPCVLISRTFRDVPQSLINKLITGSLNVMMYTFTNCLIFFYLMYRVLVKMEPTVALNSRESKRFWVSYTQGVKDFEQYELEASKQCIINSLDTIGRFHAKSRLDGIASVLWSLLLKVHGG